VVVTRRPDVLRCGTPNPPDYSFFYSMDPPTLIFVVGISFGVALAVVVTLFALGVLSLRSMLLANEMPPAKCR
jgi:hypothetical protein